MGGTRRPHFEFVQAYHKDLLYLSYCTFSTMRIYWTYVKDQESRPMLRLRRRREHADLREQYGRKLQNAGISKSKVRGVGVTT